MARLAAAASLAGAALAAQANGPVDCAALVRASLTDGAIDSAVVVPAMETAPAGGGRAPHCLVKGTLEPRTGIGEGGQPRRFATGFELRMPLQWNGRLFFQGGGGTDGVVRPAWGFAGSTPGQTPALDKGYAVVSTDAGHQGADASFGLDPQSRIDWAYRSVDIVATAAKRIVAAHYGRAPQYSYFLGCSNGGRQGMIASQRYPSQFDGIVVGNPGYRLPISAASGTTRTREFQKVSPPGADGRPDLTRAFSPAELAVVGAKVLAACDALDGAADGLVENGQACRFDLQSVVCRAGQAGDCLAPEKAAALAAHFAATRAAAGRPVYPGFPFDPGIAEPGWALWTLGQSGVSRANAGRPGPAHYVFVTPPDAAFSASEFVLDRDLGRFLISDALMSADSVDLTGFKLRGGKMIAYHGVADPVFSSLDTVRYFDALAQAQGGREAMSTFARLFLVPGMNHCSGGAALDSFDMLTPLVEWVEKGVAPDAIRATGTFFPGRARPLCVHPAYAKYRGSGSVDDFGSFACTSP